MRISKKCQYALRAVFDLASRNAGEPIKIHDIARDQGISARFLEVILNDLKHGGFVESRRGNEGGYMLARRAEGLTVREIIEYIEGRISLAPDWPRNSADTAFLGNEAFRELWQEVNNAICEVCDKTTFANLVEFERAKRDKYVLNYNI